MATYCAQNVGAGRIDRIRKGFRSAAWMGAVYAVATGILIFFFGKYMTCLLYTSKKDIMHDVAENLGCRKLFWRIRFKPGSPAMAFMYDSTCVLCLSGNPFGEMCIRDSMR